MRPLLYLSLRSSLNGLKRALKDPKRLIGLLFFVAYFGWFLGGRIFGAKSGIELGDRLRNQALDYPPTNILSSVSFFIFALLSLVFMAQAGTQKPGFRQADVDVLFATPVSTRVVYLYRLLRELLLTLATPLILILMFWRSGGELWRTFFRDVPQAASPGDAMAVAVLAWMLLSVAWVSVLNAVMLFTNRSDVWADRMRARLNWSMAFVFAATVGFVFLHLYGKLSFSAVMDLGQSVVLRTVFFSGTLASWLVMGPLAGQWTLTALGALGLLAMAFFGYRLALTQIDWMYDQAAIKVAEGSVTADRQRKGDMLGAAAEQARRKPGKRSRRQGWLHRLNMPGAWALVWKEYFLLSRGTLAILLMFLVVTVGSGLMSLLAPTSGRLSDPGGVTLLVILTGCAFATSTTLSQMGFIESLRRVDLLKPLPFTPTRVAFFDILSKAVMSALPTLPAVVLALAFRPTMWQWGLAALLASMSLCLVVCSSGFLVMVLFPDIEDPTQRGLRGLVQMLAMGAMTLPGILVVIGLLVLRMSPVLATLAGMAVSLGISMVCALISGRLYADFNPSE